MLELKISLPKPFPLQEEIMRDPAKRKVICAGRRAGKTTLAALIATERLLKGERVLLTSTTQDQADTFWEYIKVWLAPIFENKLGYKNETRRIITIGRGRLRVKTGSTPDVLRGDDADLIVFDECALLDPQTWFAVAAPMLADRDGDAVFISSPRRRNWFFRLYQRAVADGDRYKHWHYTTHANPTLSNTVIEELAEDMTEDMYKQEILAEFLEADGQVFRKVRDAVYNYAPTTGSRYVAGVDWAMVNDYTVITVVDTISKHVVDIDRFKGVDWALQRGRLYSMAKKWDVRLIIAEANSIGAPNIEALKRDGLPVQAFTTTGKSKPPLIEALVLAFEREVLKILPDDILINELEAYERVVSPLTGHSRYNAPQGLHDDCVMSLALAWHGANRTAIQTIDNEASRWLADFRG